ncbi:DnaJ family domain-containing protein [uncultured Pseudokineococcus sp.]|uniref:DnaJ family domain-containing protein n=1 Tax=uncultured Pseudokineococcus sp. TaxID=1642928 RepID=UPI00262F9584|nr:DnaJ family domain-containing protein [uncultured Pseudokineococcus sp.]
MDDRRRRPHDVPVTDWVEQQIRDAQQRGAFTGLRLEGRPIPDLHRQRSSHQWVLDWAEREGADLSAAMPVGLALRRERAALRAEVPELRSEEAVRELVADFNGRLRDAYLRPVSGPPLAVGPLDLEVQLERWRAANPPRPAPAPPDPPPRPWWRRRRR